MPRLAGRQTAPRPLLHVAVLFRIAHDARSLQRLSLGGNVLTILVITVIVAALVHGKHLPKSKLYLIWLVFGIYLYLSMWLGTALGNAPPPLWLGDANFTTWKDYMLIPLVFVAAGLVIEDRKSIRTVILITAISLLFIDRSCIFESMSRTWTTFEEDKRGGGLPSYGSNQTAAFLAQFTMFFLGLRSIRQENGKFIILSYGLVANHAVCNYVHVSLPGRYMLALLVGVLFLGILKDRKAPARSWSPSF